MLPQDFARATRFALLRPALEGLAAGGADCLLAQTYVHARQEHLLDPQGLFLDHARGKDTMKPGTVYSRAIRLKMKRKPIRTQTTTYQIFQGPRLDIAMAEFRSDKSLRFYPESAALDQPLDSLTPAQCAQLGADLDRLWRVRHTGDLIAFDPSERAGLFQADPKDTLPAWLPGRRAPVTGNRPFFNLMKRMGERLALHAILDDMPNLVPGEICITFGRARRTGDGGIATTPLSLRVQTPHSHMRRPPLLLPEDHPFCTTALRHLAALPLAAIPTSGVHTQCMDDLTVRNHTAFLPADTFTIGFARNSITAAHAQTRHAWLAACADWERVNAPA